MPGEDMEIISEQLSILENHHALAEIDRNAILAGLATLQEKDPQTFKKYSTSISKGLPGVTGGVIGLIKAKKSGDPYAISIASLNMSSGVVTMLAPMLGPAAPAAALVSALLGMISTILGEFLPKAPSLKDELTEVFNKFLADAKLRKLELAAGEIWKLSDTIEHHKDNSTEYDPLNLFDGSQVKAIEDVWAYLLQEDTQSLPRWPKMLEKTLLLMCQLFKCVALEVTNPSTKAGITGKTPITYLPSLSELYLDKLRKVKPAAQTRGMGFELGWTYNSDVVRYSSPVYAVNKSEGNGVRLNDATGSRMSAVRDGTDGEPTYHLATITTENDGARASFSPPYTRADAKWEKLRDYPPAPWSDIWAVPGGRPDQPADEAAKDEFCVWVAAGTQVTGRVQHKNGSSSIFFGPHSIPGGNYPWDTVRAVHHPKALLHDPDYKAEPGRLKGSGYIIYQGGPNTRSTGLIYVTQWCPGEGKYGANPTNADGWVMGPWGSNPYTEIRVDRHFLWIFAPLSFACATHASVLSAAKRYRETGQNQTPRWIHAPSSVVREMTSDPSVFPVTKGFGDLSPCDDGTLRAAQFNGSPSHYGAYATYAAAYRVDIGKGTMELDRFTKVWGVGPRVQKEPIYCWPLLESLTEYLQDQVGDSHHRP